MPRARQRPLPDGGRGGRGVEDANVERLVSFLASIPDSSPAATEIDQDHLEPPTKRAKLSNKPDYITLLQQELSFSAQSRSVASARIHRRNAGEYVKIRYDSLRATTFTGPARHDVQLSPRPRTKVPQFLVTLPLGEAKPPAKLETAILVADELGSVHEADGRLWASVDIDLTQDGHDVNIGLTIRVFWNESEGISAKSRTQGQLNLREIVLATCFPDLAPDKGIRQERRRRVYERWPPQKFYEASYVPPQDSINPALQTAEIPGITTKLYPFQRRTIAWLLDREHASWTKKTGTDETHAQGVAARLRPPSETPISFTVAKDTAGQDFSLSPLLGVVAKDPSRYWSLQDIRGGILAEEMGLGKTLEVIALLLLHRRPSGPSTVFDPFSERQLRPTGATLIIAPSSLLDQWMAELKKHAPKLNVTYYSGFKSFVRNKKDEATAIKHLASSDVVMTTYEVLRPEVHLALEPPARSMRGEKRYERPKSPLMELSWWRVCIDEAQMVENWATNAATLARLIPRVNAWAITGTPVKDDVQNDLRGLLSFLRFEPYASDTQIWNSLFKFDKESLRKLVNFICLRHTKGMVRDEIALPPQKRYVITMPFSAVEEQHYQSLYKELINACGLDTHGNPTSVDWSYGESADSMRIALDRLRQTALHPEVGVHNRRALGHRQGPMRTVSEVLDAMLEHSDAALRSDQRGLLSTKLTRGQVLAGLGRVRDALAIWEDVVDSSSAMVADCREKLREEAEQARIQESNRAASQSADDEDNDSKEEAVPVRVNEARRRLRYALEIQHMAVFFCANAYFTTKSNQDITALDSDEFKALEKKETESYDLAKAIRKEILQETHDKVGKLMAKLTTAAGKQAFTVIPELAPMDKGGIESHRIVEAFENIGIELDNQADQLDDWREHVIQLLLKPLLDEENDDITGEEYEDSTKLQDEILVYVQVLRTAVADRQEAISGQKNFLVEHEYKMSIRQAKEGEGAYPEKMIELFQIRDAINPQSGSHDALSSLRGVVAALRALSTKLRNDIASGSSRASAEQAIVLKLIQHAQAQVTKQTKVATSLEQEVELFTNAMNARLDFYRQLQGVSGMVADYSGDVTEQSLAAIVKREDTARQALATAQAKHRYLVHLKEAESGEEEQRLCIICQSEFSVGVLTVCGHQFCKGCINLWFRAHHNCPVCKRHLDRANLHDITLKPRELKVHTDGAEPHAANGLHTSPSSKKSSIYTEFNPEKLAEIKNVDLDGPSFTTKVNTLVRHLLWLRESDPGAKSIVFSQYKDFMDVLALAFKRYRIGYTSFDKSHGVSNFQDDPGVEVFLLHARAHSSGLNLVNASHVFLCEPLLNTALELQAIARVDRIGQQQETTVWLYIVDGTVEESIYNLSVQKRMQHMGRSNKGKSKESASEPLDAELANANSHELEQARLSRLMGKGGVSGEAVDMNDLWDCLFGHTQRKGGEQQLQRQLEDDEQIQENPAIRGFLAAEAAEGRRRNGDGGEASRS